jgi:hypothetical protein
VVFGLFLDCFSDCFSNFSFAPSRDYEIRVINSVLFACLHLSRRLRPEVFQYNVGWASCLNSFSSLHPWLRARRFDFLRAPVTRDVKLKRNVGLKGGRNPPSLCWLPRLWLSPRRSCRVGGQRWRFARPLDEKLNGKDLEKMKFTDRAAQQRAVYEELTTKYPRAVEPYKEALPVARTRLREAGRER